MRVQLQTPWEVSRENANLGVEHRSNNSTLLHNLPRHQEPCDDMEVAYLKGDASERRRLRPGEEFPLRDVGERPIESPSSP